MTKQRILFILLIALLWSSNVHAQLIRGYDMFHHGTSISSCVTLREGTNLKKFYFRKIIGFQSTHYKLSAYDKNYHNLFTENSTLILTLDQAITYQITPEKTSSLFPAIPFHETELNIMDIHITSDIIAKLKEANSVELAFAFVDTPTFTYVLPQKKLDEWKKVIASEN